MAREGIPRIRHLEHRALDRVKRQPNLSDFVAERATSLTQYTDGDAIWDRLKVVSAEALASEVDIPV